MRGRLTGAFPLSAGVMTLGLCAGAGAWAQPVSGPYVSLGAGADLVQDEHTKLNADFPAGRYRFDTGISGLGAVGWGFGNGFRAEIEGNWRQNDARQFLGTGFPTVTGGRQQNYGAMANVLFDMDVRSSWIYPYFGVGAGYSETRWLGVDTISTTEPYELYVQGKRGNFAFQAMFGLSFPVSFVPGLSVTAEYRFFDVTGNGDYGAASGGFITGPGVRPYGAARGTLETTTDYNHALVLGLRYALFTPPAPAAPAPAEAAPVPAPAPAPARTYLVFFDWDRSDLTDRARAIVAEAAQASTRVQLTRIEVNGYTDLSGTRTYNQALSVRRAESVQNELVRDGVPQASISIHGYGESHPLVPTAQGVREPQNRRVEIILT